MEIRGTDIEINAGSGESITYKRVDKTYDDDGKLISKVDGVFVDGEDVIEFKIYDEAGIISTITCDIIDGKAVATFTSALTIPLEPKTYTYDVFWTHLTDDPICIIKPANFEVVITSETNLGS